MRELVNLNSCELLQSHFDLVQNFDAAVALDYIAEISEQILPPNEPSDRFFRLIGAVLDHMHERAPGSVWTSVTYFSLWATRLSGFLPDLSDHPDRTLSQSSRDLASAMLRKGIADLPAMTWTPGTALDLRRFLVRRMEEHVERHFRTPAMLEHL